MGNTLARLEQTASQVGFKRVANVHFLDANYAAGNPYKLWVGHMLQCVDMLYAWLRDSKQVDGTFLILITTPETQSTVRHAWPLSQGTHRKKNMLGKWDKLAAACAVVPKQTITMTICVETETEPQSSVTVDHGNVCCVLQQHPDVPTCYCVPLHEIDDAAVQRLVAHSLNVLKIYELSDNITMNEHDVVKKVHTEEAGFVRKISRLGIGPKILEWAYNQESDTFTIKFERWDSTLTGRVDELPPDMVAKLRTQIESLHDAGYVHFDIQPKNVLIKRDSRRIVDITLTDFGLAERTRCVQFMGCKYLKTIYDYHANLLNNHTACYLHAMQISFSCVQKNPALLDLGLLYYLENMRVCEN